MKSTKKQYNRPFSCILFSMHASTAFYIVFRDFSSIFDAGMLFEYTLISHKHFIHPCVYTEESQKRVFENL